MSFNLEQASINELYKAATKLGVKYKLPIKKVVIKAMVKEALLENPTGLDEEVPEPEVVEEAVLEVAEVPPLQKKVKLIIHESSDPHAVNPVFVGLQGKGFTINRGHEVEVPQGVADILENARETVYDKSYDDKGALIMTPRDALSYPYTIVG